MAGNDWLNGYLEAILDAGSGRSSNGPREEEKNKINRTTTSLRKRFDEKLKFEKFEAQKEKEGKLFSPTKYFVEEVVNSFDESDLYRTWIKVVATRNSRERNNRLENMCWRIWHLVRKKKQIAWDDAQNLVKRRLEHEKGRSDAAEDLSEISEGEKEKSDSGKTDFPTDNISRIKL